MLLFQTSLQIQSKITLEIIFQTDDLGKNSTMIGLSPDHFNQTLWLNSTRELYSLDWSSEKANIWSAYAKVGKLNDALKATDDSDHLATLHGMLGDKKFSSGQYVNAVNHYSQSSKSFEEVALKFLNIQNYTLLQRYLASFLERLKKLIDREGDSQAYRTQRILLCTWIIELKLNDIS